MPIPFSQTKPGRVYNLLKMLEQGPSFAYPGRNTLTREEAAAQYKLWVDSWILPEARALLPQRKERK